MQEGSKPNISPFLTGSPDVCVSCAAAAAIVAGEGVLLEGLNLQTNEATNRGFLFAFRGGFGCLMGARSLHRSW